jgi:catechol 2,3-dioxygenase-like lactoylglutathione lyase family enzyme
VIDVRRVDYIRVPVTDMQKANHFYGEILGLERNPNSPDDNRVEYETGNVTFAVMTPHTTITSSRRCRPERLLCASPTWPRRRRSWRRPGAGQ